MADQQALNATFFAFKKRERSGVLLQTTLAFAIAAAVLTAIFVGLFWQSIGPVLTWYAQIIEASMTNDTAAIEAAGFPMEFFGLFGGLLLWMFPLYLLCAAYEAACLRWMIHGEHQGFMGLTLGAATWRVWSVYWIWLLLNIAFSIVMSIIMGLVVGTLTIASGGDPGAITSSMAFVYVLQYALMIYFAVRLAPAAATTIARRKFSFFQAWTVTRGRFWPLLGSFAIVYFLYFAAIMILTVGAFALLLSAILPQIISAASDPPAAASAATEIVRGWVQLVTQPQNWIVLGLVYLAGVIIALLFYVATFGINARAAQAALEEGKIQQA